ncbi:hypothetical protein BDV18DRAFT_128507 [Aspergillus unguis]
MKEISDTKRDTEHRKRRELRGVGFNGSLEHIGDRLHIERRWFIISMCCSTSVLQFSLKSQSLNTNLLLAEAQT